MFRSVWRRCGLPDAEWSLPADIRVIALSPAPQLPWSLVWRADSRHPLLARLRAALRSPVAFDPATQWLPEPDRADLPQTD